jgi:1-deoxy-D-xylulose-5-phosphate reductoisomerase
MRDGNPKRIAILGSTGSIGTQALDIISQMPQDTFEIEVLTAHRNSALLIEQTRHFQPNSVVITDDSRYSEVKEALADLPVKVFAGHDSAADAACMDSVDVVLAAMVGFSGLTPVIKAIEAGKTIALANKETLVVAGEIMTRMMQKHRAALIPVDSEHSAIFQSILGENYNEIENIFLTASGGPFLGMNASRLASVTPADALKHPTWNMGNKVTIDSATLMNKGLEMIEARWLFGIGAEKIKVLVHPQSIIHSMVSFCDGSVKAQMGIPDMRMPILYALSFPQRMHTQLKRYNPAITGSLTFAEPDTESFPCLSLAYDAIKKGGNCPCVMNAANEVAVHAFLEEKIMFTQIPEIVSAVMSKSTFVKEITAENLLASDNEARIIANKLIP